MNVLILNREGFEMPADGWYQIAPLGEFGHGATGLVQVVDREACEAMVNRFGAESEGAHFPGLLVDFDHFSLDGEKRSEAAGWIVALEARGVDGPASPGGYAEAGPASSPAGTTPRQSPAGAGLWAKIRWSDVGEAAVKGGRYRFLSPVWARSDCVDLGPDAASGRERVRPVRLLNAAVTNDPNLKGLRPLSNSSTSLSAGSGRDSGQLAVSREQAAAGGGGDEMKAAEVEVGESKAARRQAVESLRNVGWTDEARLASLAVSPASPKGYAAANGVLANIGWTDEARSASLAVRRAKGAARRGAGTKKTGQPGEEGLEPIPRFDASGRYWVGGTPYFDERTGEYRYPWPGQPEIPVRKPPKRRVPGWEPMPGSDPISWSPSWRVAADKAARRSAGRGK